MTDPLALPPPSAGITTNLAFVGRWLLLGGAAGAVAGLLVGGVGGRLAMFVLRLTSSDSVRGVESDDGFTIGTFSFATIFLLLIASLFGLLVGIVCVALRSQLRGRGGGLMIVVAGGMFGAAAIIEPGGVDFTFLDPLLLACAMFTVIPLAGVALTIVLIDRWRHWWWSERRRTVIACSPWILAVPSFFVAVPVFSILLVGGGGALRLPFVRAAVTNRVGSSTAFALTAVVAALATVALVRDITEIL